MRIGVFGGSFNPFHEGHLKVTQIAIKKLNLDQLWIVPVVGNPFKDGIIDHENRVKDILKEVNFYKKIKIKMFDQSSFSTFKMLNHIKIQNPKDDLFFIMGVDNIENLHQWDDFERLIKNYKLAFFSRDNYFLNLKKYKAYTNITKYSKKNSNNLIFRMKNVKISSTILRNYKK